MSNSEHEAATLQFDNPRVVRELFGVHDAHLRMLEELLQIEVGARGQELTLSGDSDAVGRAAQVLTVLYSMIESGTVTADTDFAQAIRLLVRDPNADMRSMYDDRVKIATRRKTIRPRTPGQKQYLDAIRQHDLVFGVGPAGTGKTYLAMAMAVENLLKKQYERIILCRPAVEAGEKLGYLPGNMQEKVNPYLRPLYDALHDMMDAEQAQRLIDEGVVEVAPLAFMRGRTLAKSFVILDEAQNCTPEQMKMFLTRLGPESKAVITGDISQIDLPGAVASGLVEAIRILQDVTGISIHYLRDVDVVRHHLVQSIIRAYAEKGGRGI